MQIGISMALTSLARAVNAFTPTARFPLKASIVADVGSAAISHTRATTATVVDFEGILRTALSGEVRFHGARRVRNLLTATATLSTQNVTVVAGTHVFSMSSDGSVTFSGAATGTLSGTAGQRKAVTITTTAGTLTVTVTGSVTLAQLEDVTGQANQNPSEYVSVGVLSAPFHGANVDGVKYSTTANGTTVSSNVVTDATGAALTDTTAAPIGILVEPSATNSALHSRDWTNAAWAKTNATAAKDSVGIDGVTNGASSITATAGNATVLQTVTLSSAARCFSVDIKRVTGTGNVDITLNGGSTWTTVTGLSSAVFTRYFVTATVTNPQFGVRLVTSGDKVIVDYGQLEAGTVPTSRIATTTTSVTRNADAPTVPLSLVNDTAGTVVIKVQTAFQSGVTDQRIVGNSTAPLYINPTSLLTFDGANVASAILAFATRKAISNAWGAGTMRLAGTGATAASATYDGTWNQSGSIPIGRSASGVSVPVVLSDLTFYASKATDAQQDAAVVTP